MKQPPADPSDIGRLADEFVAQDAANAGRGGKLPGGKLPGSRAGQRGDKGPGSGAGPRTGKGVGGGSGPRAGTGPGGLVVGVPGVGGSGRATKGSPDRPRKGVVPLPLPGPLPAPPPPPSTLFGPRTIGVLIGLLVILLLVGGGFVLLSGQPSSTFGALPSNGLVGVGSPAATTVGPASPGTTAVATQPPVAPTALPKSTPTSGPAKPTPKPTAKPQPTSRPTIIAFIVSPTKVAGDCKSGLTAFPMKLNNSGSNVALNWSVTFAANPDVKGDWGTAKPSSGQVAAGAVTTVSITPQNLCPSLKTQTSFTLDVNAGKGGTTAVTYTVTP